MGNGIGKVKSERGRELKKSPDRAGCARRHARNAAAWECRWQQRWAGANRSGWRICQSIQGPIRWTPTVEVSASWSARSGDL